MPFRECLALKDICGFAISFTRNPSTDSDTVGTQRCVIPVAALGRDAVHHTVEHQQAGALLVSTWPGIRPRTSLSAIPRASLMLTTPRLGFGVAQPSDQA